MIHKNIVINDKYELAIVFYTQGYTSPLKPQKL
jgi:hypothetical protein